MPPSIPLFRLLRVGGGGDVQLKRMKLKGIFLLLPNELVVLHKSPQQIVKIHYFILSETYCTLK